MFKCFLGSLCAAVGLLAGNALALEMTVAPHVLSLKASGQVVTVHTDVNYGDVLACSLSVNGTDLDVNTFADDCGNLVVQCLRVDVVAALGANAATANFILVVETADGVSSATDSVPVRR